MGEKGNLFQSGDFRLHSGGRSGFKIDCDALTEADWDTLAAMIASRFVFGMVEGVPRGGLKLAQALYAYAQTPHNGLLIVDDVLTTGGSMAAQRAGRLNARGVVVFARGVCPPWVTPLWQWGF